MFLQMNNSFSQNIDTVINLGDSLFSEKKYHVALNEYQRAYFFSDKEKKVELSHKIADCNLLLKEFDVANAYCDSAIFYSTTDSAKIDCKLHKILCFILEKDYGFALLKLDEIKTDSNTYYTSKKNFYMGISYLWLEKYDEAYQLLEKVIKPSDRVKLLKLQKIFKSKNKLKQPNPTLATILSIVIPGSGQIYTGNYSSGINSLLLLAGLTYLGIYSSALYLFVTPFIPRYYIGGIVHAKQFAFENRKIKQYNFVKDVLTLFPEKDKLSMTFDIDKIPTDFHNHVINSDAEIPILISASFLFYKKFISSQDVNACVFHPSCSVYMIETIKKNGVVTGLLDGIDRLLRCHSFVNTADYPFNKISEKYYDSF